MSSTIVGHLVVTCCCVIAPAALPSPALADPDEDPTPAVVVDATRPDMSRHPARLAFASSPPADAAVRTTDPIIAAALAKAAARSPTFQGLVERLRASDVVVYVRTHYGLPASIDGQLTFLGAGGNRRYVFVNLAWGRSDTRLIATLAHELQHAVEVAERSDIVDSVSLGRVFESFGMANARGAGRTYETQRAIDTGARVLAEMTEDKRAAVRRAPELEIR